MADPIKRKFSLQLSNPKDIQLDGEYSFSVGEFSIYEIPYPVYPTIGEHDYLKCEFCQNAYQKIYKILTDKYLGNESVEGFPNCCEGHKNLIGHKDFERKDFDNSPQMTAEKVIFTKQHIVNNINTKNWEKTINDYIDWCVESFGEMPRNCGLPLFLNDYYIYLKETVEKIKIDSDKKAKIISYLEKKRNNKPVNIDFEAIMAIYEKWYQMFPFHLAPQLSRLKNSYRTIIPFIKDTGIKNEFTGSEKLRYHTKDTLLEALENQTDSMLRQFTEYNLKKVWTLNEAKQAKFDLIITKRKHKLKEPYKGNPNNKERRYVKLLNKWYRDEKEFIDELISVLKDPIEVDVNNDNPYPNIFISVKGFRLFEALKSELVNEKTKYSDYSYIYYKMLNDSYLHNIKQQGFIDFLDKHYGADLGDRYSQFKSRNSSNAKKDIIYRKIKKDFR
ncbi:MAG: hypothetical protein MH137_02045 [Flavobacteriales bacterium]|nr:hypothetical protein [Flavobacteriales bacterium]